MNQKSIASKTVAYTNYQASVYICSYVDTGCVFAKCVDVIYSR